jgi:hypothetical protein
MEDVRESYSTGIPNHVVMKTMDMNDIVGTQLALHCTYAKVCTVELCLSEFARAKAPLDPILL